MWPRRPAGKWPCPWRTQARLTSATTTTVKLIIHSAHGEVGNTPTLEQGAMKHKLFTYTVPHILLAQAELGSASARLFSSRAGLCPSLGSSKSKQKQVTRIQKDRIDRRKLPQGDGTPMLKVFEGLGGMRIIKQLRATTGKQSVLIPQSSFLLSGRNESLISFLPCQ